MYSLYILDESAIQHLRYIALYRLLCQTCIPKREFETAIVHVVKESPKFSSGFAQYGLTYQFSTLLNIFLSTFIRIFAVSFIVKYKYCICCLNFFMIQIASIHNI